MSKAIKEGQIIQNRLGQFAKVIAIKGGFYYLTAWFSKKDQAQEAETRASFVNEIGLARITGDAEPATQDSTESLAPEKDDDASGDEDPFKDFTNADLKDALKENDLPVSGNRSQLIARLQENGIELVAE